MLITGASGQLGAYLLRELHGRKTAALAWSGSRSGNPFGVPLQRVDLADLDRLPAAFAHARPEAVIHAGAITTVAECLRDPQRARQVNTRPTEVLADLSARAGARLIFLSTDLVFDGRQGRYREQDAPAPLSVYGRTKLEAEQAVLAAPRGVVVRLSLLFGPSLIGRPSFFDDQVAALRSSSSCTLFEDEWRSPLALLTAAQAVLSIALSDFEGLLHLGGPERLSRFEMGRRLAAFLAVPPELVRAASRSQVASGEPRPLDASLDSSRWRALFPGQPWPTWSEALRQMDLA
jgi:dTDP-4-dehydrorhamnose reductase